MHVDLIIPALNEELSIGDVVRAAKRPPVRQVIVADNGSSDATAQCAREAGAQVVFEPERGYGAACLRALAALPADTHIVVFADGDGSDDLDDIARLIAPIVDGTADFVIGSRALGKAEPGALTLPQRFGNAIAAQWLSRRFGVQTTDLGPFRAIRRDALDALNMRDRNYGWTVEMQIKAARQGLRYREIAVPYKNRIGKSKVSGTVRGVFGAGYKIIGLLAYYDFIARDGDAR